MEGEFPNLPKAVAIISPHTSNIDAWHGFTALLGLGIQITIFGKHTLFETPLKPLLELDWCNSGGAPFSSRTYPSILLRLYEKTEKIWVGMAPEGTRKQAENIRSGFYHIAYGAHIPIVMFSFDYAHKTIHILGVFHPTGDYAQDLDAIYTQYTRQIFG